MASNIMVYFGNYHNGKIIPEGELRLPEGSRVRIEPVTPSLSPVAGADPFDTLGDDAVSDPSLPADLASEHDHYIYGTPRCSDQNGA